MNALHWQTISGEMRIILNEFFQSPMGEKFYLAGGTALALQLGHRQSVDLDFFSETEDIPSIRAGLEQALAALQPELSDSSWGNLTFTAKQIRVGFYGYGYAMVRPLVEYDALRLASAEDIGLMKMDALLSRANRKDFYDLYFISQRIPLKKLFALAQEKYPSVRDFEVQVTKRLIYFESADRDPDPMLALPITWDDVKNYFAEQARKIGQSWLS
jgi:hypothetical protein